MSTEEEVKVEEKIETKSEEKQIQKIDVDFNTAFNLKLQEFDKSIAQAEAVVYELKKQKAAYIYDSNVQQVVSAHNERLLKAQIEEETMRKLSGQK